jgi:hypothetical protein
VTVALKAFGRLGYFPGAEEVPAEVIDHVRRDLRLPPEVAAVYASTRTAERHRMLIRARCEPGGKSGYNRLKRTARRPSWTNFRLQLEQLRWVDELGDARTWWAGVAPSKIADFAGEAASADAAVLGDYAPDKRAALLAAMVFAAQAKARDDVAEMFCRRVGTLTKRSRKEFEELKEAHRGITERLVSNDKAVLERIDPAGMDAA